MSGRIKDGDVSYVRDRSPIDEVIGEIGNISEGEVLDLSPFTVAMSQQVVLVASAILDTLHDRNVYGSFLRAHGRDVKSTAIQSAAPQWVVVWLR